MAELSRHGDAGKHQHSGWRIAISQRECAAAPGREAYDALDTGYVPWLMRVLNEPMLLPLLNLADTGAVLRQVDAFGINALLLSGGGDLGDQPRRESMEYALLDVAVARSWPVLGICRGMQLLQQRDGGDIVRLSQAIGVAHPITELDCRTYTRLTNTEHVAGSTDTLIHIPPPRRRQVNSWHHYGILQPAPGWQPLARADDGSIEAFRHGARPWLGLMWHPEREHGEESLVRPWLDSLFSHTPLLES